MPETSTNSFAIPLDGSGVVVPIRADALSGGQRVVVQGTFRCGYNSRLYDALYQCDRDGAADTARPHAYLSWQPRTPSVEDADVRRHRYVLRFESLARGVAPTVRVDIDKFVNEFLIPPSEVRRSLTGQLTATVQSAAPPVAWPFALAAAPALAIAGGAAWVIRRRMANRALDFDLTAQLARIHLKADAARKAVRREDARILPIDRRITSLAVGADALARQVQEVRDAIALNSRFALERDIAALKTHAYATEASEDHLQTLIDKQNALASLTDLERTRTVLSARLNRVEAALESTLASLQTVRSGALSAPISDNLCRCLDAEVSALREATLSAPEKVLLTRSPPS